MASDVTQLKPKITFITAREVKPEYKVATATTVVTPLIKGHSAE